MRSCQAPCRKGVHTMLENNHIFQGYSSMGREIWMGITPTWICYPLLSRNSKLVNFERSILSLILICALCILFPWNLNIYTTYFCIFCNAEYEDADYLMHIFIIKRLCNLSLLIKGNILYLKSDSLLPKNIYIFVNESL